MGTKRDFKVKKGLVVEDGDVTLASDHSVFAGIFDTNITAAGVTLTGTTLAADGTDANINIALTPKGTGEVDITKVDIGSGAIDGTTIGAASATTGAFTTLTTSSTAIVGTDLTVSGGDIIYPATASTLGMTAATGTDTAAGSLTISTATATGDEAGGALVLKTGGAAGSAGTTATTAVTALTLAAAGGASFLNSVSAGNDFTVGSTVITDDSIVMTPSASDTITIAAATNGILNITTVDDDATAADVNLTVDGQILYRANDAAGHIFNINGTSQVSIIDGGVNPVTNNDVDLGTDALEYKNVWVDGLVTSGTGVHLGFGGNSKLNVISGGVEVTGTLDASSTVYGGGFKSSLEQASAGTGVDLVSNATFRTAEDSGVFKTNAADTNFTTTHIENTNFTGSVTTTDTDGFTAAGTKVVPLVYINLDDTTNNIYHSVEFHCAMQEKVTSGNARKQWLSQMVKASYNGSTVQFQTSESRWSNIDLAGGPPPGEFCAQKWGDGGNPETNYMVISYCPYRDTANDRTITYSVNVNGLSTPINTSL